MAEVNTLEVKDGAKPGQRVLELHGPLTVTTLFSFQNALRAETAPVVIIDLTGVPYIDSAGLGALVNGYVSCQKHGRSLVLVGVADRIRNLFKITRVDQLFEMYPSVADAEAKHAAAAS